MSESKSSVNWPMICHLGGLATYIGIPFGNVLVPAGIWYWKKDSDSAVNEHGREALNFNLSFTIYAIAAGALCYLWIGYVLLPIIVAVHVVLAVQSALKANKGQSVRYPFTLRFIK